MKQVTSMPPLRMITDGRNHVPCCVNEGVPDVCQDICRGEYTIPTDDIRTHVSCSEYTEPTLACIAVGIGTLTAVYGSEYDTLWTLKINSIASFFNQQ